MPCISRYRYRQTIFIFYNEDEYVSSSDIRKKRKEIGDAYVKSGYFIQRFLEGQQRFADLFNTVLYDGKQVILPEKLMEADSNLSGSIQTKKKEDVFVERRADLIKKVCRGQ